MMSERITATACPECGCEEVVSFDLRNKHSNGQWNERLTFKCSYKIHYSPVTERSQVEEDCRRSPRHVAWKAQRDEIAAAMVGAALAVTGRSGSIDLPSLRRSLSVDLDTYREDLERVSQPDGA